jgi:hypothetical protein
MENVKQLVIIGGGPSLKEGIEKGLWEKIEGKFVIGINVSYKFFPTSTIQCYLDHQLRTDLTEEFIKLPLIITKKQAVKDYPNEIQIPSVEQYSRSLEHGIYKGALTGIYALSLAVYLLDEGEIFLLGYDYGASNNKDQKGRIVTHFYQGEIEHRGIGKVSYYSTKDRDKRDFGVFKEEKKVKIYNVSLTSKINVFDKISYDDFFNKLDGNKYDQEELRNKIRQMLSKGEQK